MVDTSDHFYVTTRRERQYLVGAVSRDYTSYYLPPEIISQFRLAPENYGDGLFIHPPLFVLLNVAGQKLAGLPLPATSLLCHIVTCLMVLLLPAGLLNFFTPGTYNSAACQRVSLWAVVVYTFCPIVTFVSQKVWIDNAAVMCVSIAAVVHLHVSTKCRDEMAIASHGTKSTRSKTLHPANSIFIGVYCSALQFSSGLVFGGLALNCKISCLALLPFIVLVSIISVLFGPTTEPRDILSIRLVFKLFQVLGALMVGILCGHGPWLYIYWVRSVSTWHICIIFTRSFFQSTTGRILPNSWPSATMLANSPFVANVKVLRYIFLLFPNSVLSHLRRLARTSRRILESSWNIALYILSEWHRLSYTALAFVLLSAVALD